MHLEHLIEPARDAPERAEWDLWHALRDNTRLLELAAESSGTELQRQARLRREFPDDQVRAALLLVDLRRRATNKFSRASRLWFDRQGLEQSTPELVARHKARRFEGDVWDLCCGIGGDTCALAARGPVVAVDVQPLALLRTLWNAEAYDVGAHVTPRAASALDLDPAIWREGWVHLDPDRRATGRRAVRVEDYWPDVAFMQQLTEGRGGAIKLSPASNFGGKFPDCEIELISLHGECKEATVWYGDRAGTVPFRATVLPEGATLAGDPLDAFASVAELSTYLYDPDPAVVRAGLVDRACEELGLQRLDAEEEYLTGPTRIDSPFVTGFEVLHVLPNKPAEIGAYFRNADFGQVEIKCRRIPIDAEAVRRKLPLKGEHPVVLIFARIEGRARVVVARRVIREQERGVGCAKLGGRR